MPSDVYKKPVVEALHDCNITIQDLIEVTGLNPQAVKRAILGGDHMIHETVAQAIAEWLDVKSWRELEWPREVTPLGRPAFTGGSYTKPFGLDPDNVCPTCNTFRSCMGTCMCA